MNTIEKANRVMEMNEGTEQIIRYCQILEKAQDPKREIYRNISGAINDSFESWCGKFHLTQEAKDRIVTAIGMNLPRIMGYIRPGDAYMFGDYLMSSVMAAPFIDSIETSIYDAADPETICKKVAAHIAEMMGFQIAG